MCKLTSQYTMMYVKQKKNRGEKKMFCQVFVKQMEESTSV